MPLPARPDDVVRQLLVAYTDADGALRASMVASVAPQHRATLLAFAERMASFAVRTGSMAILREAALSYALQSGVGDERDALPVLALLHDASLRLKHAPGRLFEWAGSLVGKAAYATFTAFLLRTNDDRSIGAMGYVVGADSDGFRYLRTW